MGTNEAPEKIYRTTLYLNNDKGETKWKRQPVAGAENIEYIRTDVFIEKACEWLKKYGGSYWMDDYDLPTDELVNDFRNYMK